MKSVIMRWAAGVLVLPLFGLVVSEIERDGPNVDPASRQIVDFKDKHKQPIGLLTTSAGKPVEIRETNTLNSDLLTNQFFIDTIKHLVYERIPEREVLTKGTGAFGYFEVTNDVTKYTKAKVFEKVGKKTPLVARLATSQVDKGGSDFIPLAVRGYSVKMYTEEGNLDFLCIQTPVYVYRDPILFSPAVHALRRNPQTNLRDLAQVADFLTLHPGALHAFLWVASEFGLPRGYRHMNAFPIHTYEIYNEHGESSFVRFKFLTELGYQSFNLTEAVALGGTDPDFFVRDLFNSIERKNFPSWRLEMDVLDRDIYDVDFDPFDVTKLWPNGTYHTVVVGRVVLNKNVNNFFADVEQAAFNPANLVPGIVGPHDKVFQGRVVAYSDAHIHRLGINHHKVEVNRPKYYKSYDRDGLPPVRDNMRDAPHYFPNSVNGPIPYVDESRPKVRPVIIQSNSFDLGPAAYFYIHILKTDAQKKRLVDNLVMATMRVPRMLVDRFAELLKKVDSNLSNRYKTTYETAQKTTKLPSVVEDLPRPKPNRYDL